MPLAITDETFAEFIRHPLAVLSFTSPWCTVCRKIHPALDALSAQHQGRIAFGSLDVSASPDTPARFGVLALPTIIVFNSGSEVSRLSGSVSRAELERVLDELSCSIT